MQQKIKKMELFKELISRLFSTNQNAENQSKESATTECATAVEYVDLGLPSGTLWAKTNYGASSPELFGKECTMSDLPEGLPTYEQAAELIEHCTFSQVMFVDFSRGWKLTGPNGQALFFRVKPNNEVYMDTDSTTLWCQPTDRYTPIMVFSENNITIGAVFDKTITSQLRQVKYKLPNDFKK